MIFFKNGAFHSRLSATFISLIFALHSPLTAAVTYVIEDGEVVGPQTLLNARDKLIVEEEGIISGGALTAVTMANLSQQVENEGLIGTTGVNAFGIFSLGPFNSIRNSGTIVTSGFNGIGIRSLGSAALIENSGIITTSGFGAEGIFVGGAATGVFNRGIIATADADSPAIAMTSANGAVNNQGVIRTKGLLSFGVFFTSLNGALINGGTIIAENAEAIRFQGVNSALALLRGSNIQGAVFLSSLGTRAIFVQKGLNLALTTTNSTWNAVDAEGNPFVLNGNQLAVVDRTGFAMEVDILDDLTRSILNPRWRCGCCLNGLRDECCDEWECYGSTWAKKGWVGLMGSYRERDRQHRIVSYDNGFGGVIAGLDLSCFSDMELGAFAGGTFGEAKVTHHTHTIKNYSGFAGLSAYKTWDDTFAELAIAGGVLVQDSRRLVMNNLASEGKEHAKADFDGGFVSPELTLGRCFCFWGIEPMANLRVRYAALFLDRYKEKGSLADIKISKRDLQILSAAAEVALPLSLPCFGYSFAVTPYLGIEGRFRLGDRHLKGVLLEESISFTDGSDDTLGALYFGVRGCHTMECGPSLFLNIEGSVDNKKSALVRGEIDLSIPF